MPTQNAPQSDIVIIAAVAENNAIGRDNGLLYHIPDDLRRFKQMTVGNTVIMGRRTWESLPRRHLPERCNIVITRNPGFSAPGVHVAHSPEAAVEMARQLNPGKRIYIIGGESIYRHFMPMADTLQLTRIVGGDEVSADAFFPEVDPAQWSETSSSEWFDASEKAIKYRYICLTRK